MVSRVGRFINVFLSESGFSGLKDLQDRRQEGGRTGGEARGRGSGEARFLAPEGRYVYSKATGILYFPPDPVGAVENRTESALSPSRGGL